MKIIDCALTLILPRTLEEEVVDHLLEHEEWVRGFTITQTEGKGRRVRLAGASEEVRGRAQRVRLQIVMNLQDARELVAHLKQHLPNPDIAYWIAPVVEFGRFA